MTSPRRIAGIETPLFPIAQGCMGFGGPWTDAAVTADAVAQTRAAVDAALAAGINLFDHADIYCRGKSEEAFGALLADTPALRDQIVLQSKCGIRFQDSPPGAPGRYDFSRTHILASVEASLQRLRTDRLDCLLLHRPDPLVEPAEVAEAFDELHAAGKVLTFGVSNHTAAQLALLRAHVRQPIVVNQLQFSLLHTVLIDSGIQSAGLSTRPTGIAGTLEYCREHDILVQAWAPLAKGVLAGRELAADAAAAEHEVTAGLQAMATAQQTTMAALALAWILRHPAGIQPVIGSRRPPRIAEACRSVELTLSREQWYQLFIAGRGERLP
jgi:predicted oxidoreductase